MHLIFKSLHITIVNKFEYHNVERTISGLTLLILLKLFENLKLTF